MRDMESGVVTALGSRETSPALLAWFEFDSAEIGMWSGYGDIVWDGKTFHGGGSFIGISAIEETQDIVAKGVTLSLNGISSENIAACLTEDLKNRPVTIWWALLSNDPEGAYFIEDPVRVFSGLMDTVEFTDSGETSDIRLTVENVLYIGQRAKVARYTDEDQRKKYPNDTGLSRINNLQDKELVW